MAAELNLETDPKSLAELVLALGNMSASMKLLVFSAFVIWLAAWRGFAMWDKRQQARADAAATAQRAAADRARDEQARRLNETMGRMCQLLEQHTVEEENHTSTTNISLSRLSDNVGELGRCVHDLQNRLSNVMSHRDSLSAITDRMTGGLAADAAAIFDQSLRKNDYAGRPDFIKERVKTALGKAVGQAYDKLRTEYKLSIELDPFFPTRPGSGGGVRYVLCDTLWDRVEPLYRRDGDKDRKVEEMRVTVSNVVGDLVSSATEHATDLYRDHTPAAGAPAGR
jgi:hypothetical protein